MIRLVLVGDPCDTALGHQHVKGDQQIARSLGGDADRQALFNPANNVSHDLFLADIIQKVVE